MSKIESLYNSRQTISLYLLRKTLDYAIFSTDGYSLDTIRIPQDEGTQKSLEYLVLSENEQFRVESQTFHSMIIFLADGSPFLSKFRCTPEKPCFRCPKCVLFGTSNTASPVNVTLPTMPSRVIYYPAVSIESYQEAVQIETVESPNESAKKTSFATQPVIRPNTHFASVITLRHINYTELVLFASVLAHPFRYGKQNGIMGEMANQLIGVSIGDEPVVMPAKLAEILRPEFFKRSTQDPYPNNWISSIYNLLSREITSKPEIYILQPEEMNKVYGFFHISKPYSHQTEYIFEEAKAYAKSIQKTG